MEIQHIERWKRFPLSLSLSLSLSLPLSFDLIPSLIYLCLHGVRLQGNITLCNISAPLPTQQCLFFLLKFSCSLGSLTCTVRYISRLSDLLMQYISSFIYMFNLWRNIFVAMLFEIYILCSMS